ncbi:hypothetical protein [Micromonospora sp. NPDC005652]|uniref:hypothetical protein n=1 Tax=Micromonospora sp. NPDC005652 TaxID=3157046 RepID=UPI0033D669C7
MTQHTCVLCPVLRRDDSPRLPDHPPACEGCRGRLDWQLELLPKLHFRLGHDEQQPYNDRWYAVVDAQGRLTGERRRADPLGALGGAGPVRAPGDGAPVTGSRERTTPARLDRVDLAAPARGATVRDTMVPAVRLEQVEVRVRRYANTGGLIQLRDEWERRVQRTPVVDERGQAVLVPAGDQVGKVSVATVLRLWCTDVRDALWPRHRLPLDDVPSMVAWLRTRLYDIVNEFEAIADLAGEIRVLAGGMRAALGESEPRPQPLLGVPCQRCDARSQIVAHADGYRECTGPLGCGRLYSPREWQEWMASDEVGRLLPGGRPGKRGTGR